MFAGCTSSIEGSDYVIVGVPFDKTESFRSGASDAPEKIRYYSYSFEPYMMEYEVSLSDIQVCDVGDIDKNDSVQEMGEELKEVLRTVIESKKFPIVLGGEHSLTSFAVDACSSVYDDLQVFVLDAHLDYRDEYEGNQWSHATVNRRISELDIGKLAVAGVRSMSEGEKKGSPEFITASEVNLNDEEFLKKIKKEFCGDVYLSIDMDVIDPAFAPGVGNPEPYGLLPRQVKYIIESLSDNLVGIDMVEVTPKYDHADTTSILASKFVYNLLGSKSRTQ
ncbi:MAG: agmatinase [Thermoplasmata archaeon]